MKIWDLGKYEQCQTMVSNLSLNERRTHEQVSKKKQTFLLDQNKDKMNMPVRTMTMSECHSLLCKLALTLFIIFDSGVCISNQILSFKPHEQNVSFGEFKIHLLSLLGEKILTL